MSPKINVQKISKIPSKFLWKEGVKTPLRKLLLNFQEHLFSRTSAKDCFCNSCVYRVLLSGNSNIENFSYLFCIAKKLCGDSRDIYHIRGGIQKRLEEIWCFFIRRC